MLGEAYANGVTYFDTAYTYHNGESEPFLGSFLKQLKAGSYQLQPSCISGLYIPLMTPSDCFPNR
jgi:predicted aldo/keto reductase-like oxidoreductase